MISSFILPEYGSLVNAEAIVEFVIDLVISVCMGFVDSILVPLSEMWLGYCQGIAYAMSLMVDDQKNLGYVTDSSKMALLQAFQGDFFWLAFGLTIIITAVTIALSVMTAVVGFIVSMALSVASKFIIQSIFSQSTPDTGTVSFGGLMELDSDNPEASLQIAENESIVPPAENQSAGAIDLRHLFIASAIGASLLATFAAGVAMGQDLPNSLGKWGIFGLVVSTISIAIAFATIIDSDIQSQLSYMSLFLGIIGIVAGVEGILADNMMTKKVSWIATFIGIGSVGLNLASMWWE